MARHASLAEHYRAHRAAFVLAQELGCTPKEAEQELHLRELRAKREAWLRQEAARARCGTVISAPTDITKPGPFDQQNSAVPRDHRDAQPWMMRD